MPPSCRYPGPYWNCPELDRHSLAVGTGLGAADREPARRVARQDRIGNRIIGVDRFDGDRGKVDDEVVELKRIVACEGHGFEIGEARIEREGLQVPNLPWDAELLR